MVEESTQKGNTDSLAERLGVVTLLNGREGREEIRGRVSQGEQRHSLVSNQLEDNDTPRLKKVVQQRLGTSGGRWRGARGSE